MRAREFITTEALTDRLGFQMRAYKEHPPNATERFGSVLGAVGSLAGLAAGAVGGFMVGSDLWTILTTGLGASLGALGGMSPGATIVDMSKSGRDRAKYLQGIDQKILDQYPEIADDIKDFLNDLIQSTPNELWQTVHNLVDDFKGVDAESLPARLQGDAPPKNVQAKINDLSRYINHGINHVRYREDPEFNPAIKAMVQYFQTFDNKWDQLAEKYNLEPRELISITNYMYGVDAAIERIWATEAAKIVKRILPPVAKQKYQPKQDDRPFGDFEQQQFSKPKTQDNTDKPKR